MAGVGGLVTTKEIRLGVQLFLYYQWESDEGLADQVGNIRGRLPGEGCVNYRIAIGREDDSDSEETLQEFNFRGGGEMGPDEAPAIVWQAFHEWRDRLLGKLSLVR